MKMKMLTKFLLSQCLQMLVITAIADEGKHDFFVHPETIDFAM